MSIWPEPFVREDFSITVAQQKARATEDVERILGLSVPIRVQRIDKHLDGGSTGGTLLGANQQTVSFWWNTGMKVVPEHSSEVKLALLDGPPPEGTPLLIGSPTERALILGLLFSLENLEAFPDSVPELNRPDIGWNTKRSVKQQVLRMVNGLAEQRNSHAMQIPAPPVAGRVLEVTALQSGWVEQRLVVIAEVTNHSGIPITMLCGDGAPALPGPTGLSILDGDFWVTTWQTAKEPKRQRLLNLPVSSAVVIGAQVSVESVLRLGIIYFNTALPTSTDTTWSDPIDLGQIPTFGNAIGVGEIKLRDHLQNHKSGPTYLAYDPLDQRYEWRIAAGDSTWSFSSSDGELLEVTHTKTFYDGG